MPFTESVVRVDAVFYRDSVDLQNKLFVVKLNADGTVGWERELNLGLKVLNIYPNPSRGAVKLQWEQELKGTMLIELYKLDGSIVMDWKLHRTQGAQSFDLKLNDVAKMYLFEENTVTIANPLSPPKAAGEFRNSSFTL